MSVDPVGNPPRASLLTLKLKNFMIIMFEVPNIDEARAACVTIETLSNISQCFPIFIFYLIFQLTSLKTIDFFIVVLFKSWTTDGKRLILNRSMEDLRFLLEIHTGSAASTKILLSVIFLRT